MEDNSQEKKMPVPQPNMPAGRGEGIVTIAVRNKVDSLLSSPDSYLPIIEMLKMLEPVLIDDLHALSSKARETMVQANAPPQLHDLIGDIVATSWLRGFLLHREAVNMIDSRKLSEMYNCDFEKFSDELIDKWKQRLHHGTIDQLPTAKPATKKRGRPRKARPNT